jgi:aminoglycoside 3-N-acetyltransferase
MASGGKAPFDHDMEWTRAQLIQGLKALGVQAGQAVMVHSSMYAVGSVMGGPNEVIQALLDVLTPTGTIMMYAGWHDIPDFVEELPPRNRQRYYDHYPPFDPAIARSVRENGILVEFLRTWPGTQRSLNPEASMIALGAQAAYLTSDHPLNYGYGAGSPLEKLVSLGGKVLLLGAPLDTITLLHYSEYAATLRHKNVVRYQCPVLRDGERVWVEIEDFDTGEPHADYSFEEIAEAYLASGHGAAGTVGRAKTYLLDAADLHAFAVRWLEKRFGP